MKTINNLTTTLICEFMGGEVREVWKIKSIPEYAWFGEVAEFYRYNHIGIKIGTCVLIEQCEFHSSWEWIMPVLLKFKTTLKDICYSTGAGHLVTEIEKAVLSYEKPYNVFIKLGEAINYCKELNKDKL